jgi:hypothetical protein
MYFLRLFKLLFSLDITVIYIVFCDLFHAVSITVYAFKPQICHISIVDLVQEILKTQKIMNNMGVLPRFLILFFR